MMISKNDLLKLTELNLGEKIGTMTDNELAGYLQSLNSFIDVFPSLSNNLHDALDRGAYIELAVILTYVYENLEKLYADNLAQECRQQVAAIQSEDPDVFDGDETESFVERLIQNLSTLSIEVKMAAHVTPKQGGGLKDEAVILAVDNALMFQTTLQKYLKDAPYEMHFLTSSFEALEYLEQNEPDVILLDIEMPDMNGYELARRIKNSGHKAPVIFITANYSEEYVKKAIEVGAAGLLIKPINAKQLLAKLEEVI